MDKWIKKLWYMYNGILFSHKKGNPAICDNVEPEVKTQIDKYCIISHMNLKKQNSQKKGSDLQLPKVGGGRRGNWMKAVKRYKLPVVNKNWGCNIQHGDCS